MSRGCGVELPAVEEVAEPTTRWRRSTKSACRPRCVAAGSTLHVSLLGAERSSTTWSDSEPAANVRVCLRENGSGAKTKIRAGVTVGSRSVQFLVDSRPQPGLHSSDWSTRPGSAAGNPSGYWPAAEYSIRQHLRDGRMNVADVGRSPICACVVVVIHGDLRPRRPAHGARRHGRRFARRLRAGPESPRLIAEMSIEQVHHVTAQIAVAEGHVRDSSAAQPIADKQHGRWRQALGPVAATVIAAAKWGANVKFASVLVSMLVSIAAYTLLWGWEFAVGFVLLLLIHEYGHVLQLRREGVRATKPLFIPFLGAVIGMREMPKNAVAEAKVGLAGPAAGTAASLVVLGIYGATGAEFWRALAYTGFVLQLFNLAPVLPLDGGRAMAALSTRLWLLGWLGMVVAVVIVTVDAGAGQAFILYLIALLGGKELLHRWKARRTAASQAYHQVAVRARLLIGLAYLVLLLGTGTATVSLYLHETVNDASNRTLTQG